jgi:hypothetical protein
LVVLSTHINFAECEIEEEKEILILKGVLSVTKSFSPKVYKIYSKGVKRQGGGWRRNQEWQEKANSQKQEQGVFSEPQNGKSISFSAC